MTTAAGTCTRCGGGMIRSADDWGYGSTLACIACSRPPESSRPAPVTYAKWEPKPGQPAATIARDLTGSCIDCHAAIGARATRCNLCTGRAYEARRKVRDRARRAGMVQT